MNTTPHRAPIASVRTNEPVVALTFDDGPHVTLTAQMLAFLAREGIRATFFEVGNNVAEQPGLARAVIAAGHEIGNHGQTHRDLGGTSDVAEVRAELLAAQAVVRETTGFTPVVFRAPSLSHGPALWSVLDELQLPSVAGITAADWDAGTTSAAIIECCSKAGPGDIVLLHTWSVNTMDALPEIVRNLRANGLGFVTVSEMIALAPPLAT
jgi:peptidoglycan/xylan/chitin deacetylase (PgdA/CDA1 family)